MTYFCCLFKYRCLQCIPLYTTHPSDWTWVPAILGSLAMRRFGRVDLVLFNDIHEKLQRVHAPESLLPGSPLKFEANNRNHCGLNFLTRSGTSATFTHCPKCH